MGQEANSILNLAFIDGVRFSKLFGFLTAASFRRSSMLALFFISFMFITLFVLDRHRGSFPYYVLFTKNIDGRNLFLRISRGVLFIVYTNLFQKSNSLGQ